MTNIEALTASVGYPFTKQEVELACINRGIAPDADYSAPSRAFDLAKADLYLVAYNKPNISEGGFSVTQSEKQSFLKLRKSIFRKYGIEDTFAPDSEPEISSCKPW
jgi:hypothetical protein